MTPLSALQRIAVCALLLGILILAPSTSALAQSRNLTLLSNLNIHPPPPGGYATVSVQPAGMTVRSGRDGRYAFAVPAGGTATVTVSTFAFETTSKSVAVALNSDQTVDFPIKRLPAGVLSGTARVGIGRKRARWCRDGDPRDAA